MIRKQEIEKLYDYVKKHKVKYVDVQIELVDHLATEIEALRIENSTIDFEKALQKASRSFDIKTYSQSPHNFGEIKYLNGFRALQNQKAYDASRLLNRRMNEYFLSFVKLPRIIATIGIWIIVNWMLGNSRSIWAFVLAFGFQLFAIAYWGLKKYLFQKVSGKFIALEMQNGTYLGLFLLMLPSFIWLSFEWLGSSSVYLQLILASCYTILILASYILYIYFTDLLISEIEEKYGNHKFNFG